MKAKPPSNTRPVLLVEDDEGIRAMISLFLTAEGFRVLTAASGDDALPILAAEPTLGLLLVDLTMPGMNINEIRDALHASPRHASVPMVLISGDSALERKAAALGAAAWLEKPLELAKLLSVVEKFCLRSQ